jgi:hypothetical protein
MTTALDAPKQKIGLSERKKQKTREAIQRAAMRLFQKQGYETKIEEIAAAVRGFPEHLLHLMVDVGLLADARILDLWRSDGSDGPPQGNSRFS